MDSQNTLLPLPVAGQVLSRPGGSRLGQGFNINIARISVRTLEFQSWLERGWDIDTMRKLAIDSWQGLDILVELICGKHFKGRSVVAQVLGLNFGTFLGQCPPPPLLGVAAATGQLQQQSAAAETPSPGGQQCLFPAAARQRSLIADLGGGNRDQHSTRLVLNEEGVLKWYSQLLQFLQEFHPLPVLRQTVLKVLTTRHVDLRAALALEKPLLAHHGATGGGGSSFSSRKECAHPWIYECTQLLRGLASVKDIITSFSSLSSKSTLQKDRSSRKGKMTASATNEETQQLKTPPLLVLPDHDVNFHNELTKLLSAIHQVLAIEYVRSKVLI
uniref:Uncharacterized protein n=1 Tax=Heterosigma akashiwo TaxID=2829 RepID=A0A7S3XLW7_HETAK